MSPESSTSTTFVRKQTWRMGLTYFMSCPWKFKFLELLDDSMLGNRIVLVINGMACLAGGYEGRKLFFSFFLLIRRLDGENLPG